MSVSQVAKKLNISKHSVYALIDKRCFGWFPLLAGSKQIDSADVDDWLLSIKVPADKPLSRHLEELESRPEDELLAMLKKLDAKGKLRFIKEDRAV